MTIRTETQHAGGFLVTELPGKMSRRNGVINTPQNVPTAAVLGRILSAAAAVAGTNTGAGTVTVGAAIGRAAQIGTYRVVATTAGATAQFNLYAPDGSIVREVVTAGGATPSEHLTLTIADGNPDFAIGDSFTIEVTGGDYELLDPAATTGEQTAAGVLWEGRDATSADRKCVVIDNTAVVELDELQYPVGITDAQKATALAQLRARGIQTR